LKAVAIFAAAYFVFGLKMFGTLANGLPELWQVASSGAKMRKPPDPGDRAACQKNAWRFRSYARKIEGSGTQNLIRTLR